jgi:glycosyltransferase involved in cell wall biosynthesis
MGARAHITVVVLTYNEEVNVEQCLRSIEGWIGEIVVVDSFSSDRTLEICRRYTERIYQHAFENHGRQVNWALDNVPISHEWVMQLDADEIVTPELADELCRRLPGMSAEITGLYAKRRVYFMDRWIRYGDQYPMWLLRIFRRGMARNEEFEEDRVVLLGGRPEYLECDFIDRNRKGLTFWVEKHCRWSSTEARDMLALADCEGQSVSSVRINSSLLASQDQRRRWLKKNVYGHLPLFFRAFLYFL